MVGPLCIYFTSKNVQCPEIVDYGTEMVDTSFSFTGRDIYVLHEKEIVSLGKFSTSSYVIILQEEWVKVDKFEFEGKWNEERTEFKDPIMGVVKVDPVTGEVKIAWKEGGDLWIYKV